MAAKLNLQQKSTYSLNKDLIVRNDLDEEVTQSDIMVEMRPFVEHIDLKTAPLVVDATNKVALIEFRHVKGYGGTHQYQAVFTGEYVGASFCWDYIPETKTLIVEKTYRSSFPKRTLLVHPVTKESRDFPTGKVITALFCETVLKKNHQRPLNSTPIMRKRSSMCSTTLFFTQWTEGQH